MFYVSTPLTAVLKRLRRFVYLGHGLVTSWPPVCWFMFSPRIGDFAALSDVLGFGRCACCFKSLQTWIWRRSWGGEKRRGGRPTELEEEGRGRSHPASRRAEAQRPPPHTHTTAHQPITALVSLTHPPSYNCSSMAHWSRCEAMQAMEQKLQIIYILISATSLHQRPADQEENDVFIFHSYNFRPLNSWFDFPPTYILDVPCGEFLWGLATMANYVGWLKTCQEDSDWGEAMRARREARMVPACSPCTNIRSASLS